jgi:hypothetical protein
MTAERRAELEALAHELTRQTAWDMALEDQALSDADVEEMERGAFEQLLALNA